MVQRYLFFTEKGKKKPGFYPGHQFKEIQLFKTYTLMLPTL